MSAFLKHHLYPLVFAVVLTAFTLYAVLDTFVIEHAYETVQGPNTVSNNAAKDDRDEETDAADSGKRIDSYHQDGIDMVLTEYRIENTAVYVADIQLDSLESLKTAFAEDTYGRNIRERTSAIAEAHDAILAINGDFYGAREDGYVLRNGVLYREDGGRYNEDLAIMSDGSFRIVYEFNTTAEELAEDGAVQVFSFGPALYHDDRIQVTRGEEVTESMDSNPRTAIAMFEPLHYAFIVSDGRTKQSAGLSLYQLAEFTESLGATVSYNLDGGGSATMVFQGEVINQPTSTGRVIEERRVSDIVYIG